MNVIFDLGNVLLNWNPQAIIASLDVNEDFAALIEQELFAHQDWLDLDKGCTDEQQVIERITKTTSLTKELVEQALLAAKTSLHTIDKSLELFHEIYNSGHPVYCLSNMSVETYTAIKHKAFFDSFSGIVISGYEKCMKPDARIFEIILERYQLDPSKTLFIDDSLDNVQAARQLGIQTHHFKRTESCYQQIRNVIK